MRSVPDISMKRVRDLVVGELVRADQMGESRLGIMTAIVSEDRDRLGAWFGAGSAPSVASLKYLSANDYCLSFGTDWRIRPNLDGIHTTLHPSQKGGIALHPDGWIMHVEENRNQFSWWSIMKGERIDHASPSKITVFHDFQIAVGTEANPIYLKVDRPAAPG